MLSAPPPLTAVVCALRLVLDYGKYLNLGVCFNLESRLFWLLMFQSHTETRYAISFSTGRDFSHYVIFILQILNDNFNHLNQVKIKTPLIPKISTILVTLNIMIEFYFPD